MTARPQLERAPVGLWSASMVCGLVGLAILVADLKSGVGTAAWLEEHAVRLQAPGEVPASMAAGLYVLLRKAPADVTVEVVPGAECGATPLRVREERPRLGYSGFVSFGQVVVPEDREYQVIASAPADGGQEVLLLHEPELRLREASATISIASVLGACLGALGGGLALTLLLDAAERRRRPEPG